LILFLLDRPLQSARKDINRSTYRSRNPVWLSQRRLRGRKSHRGAGSNSDWGFDHDLAPGQYRNSTEHRGQ